MFSTSPGSAGYPEVARLAGSYNAFPTVVSIVGHCGFIELDTEFLVQMGAAEAQREMQPLQKEQSLKKGAAAAAP